MNKTDPVYAAYLALLRGELVPALGCTEPAAIAYAASCARDALGRVPEKVRAEVSGNIVKNVKSVIVPNTGGLKGIKAAAAAGIVAGKTERKLEVIAALTTEGEKAAIRSFLDRTAFEVVMADTDRVFEITLTLWGGGSVSRVRIVDSHTNVVLIEKDGKILFDGTAQVGDNAGAAALDNADAADSPLSVAGIIDFASSADLEDVRDLIERQIEYNSAISARGLREDFGANIGKVLLKNYGTDIKVLAKAAAAAGSDARMSGCALPVIILSGSGNQGITASLPVIEYAGELGSSREELIRALLVSDLVTLHLKSGIGRLSAYCGVVSAGAGAGAGISYLKGGRFEEVSHTIVNALAIVSGIVCDGAKPSCAAKIAAAVDAGILGGEMYDMGQQFYGGEGLIVKGVENTIRNISRLGKEGMRKTDKEIIRIMLEDQ
ncbi:MAG: L-serine ammonia-lyase, iron-sulfur-dependent, subunit alpha [Treponema sp.]|jgi:L-cysteine desulfidase|nr:L-serine ammonia-lyase, iron-sulfur-dependent, subunit alpha [Treponema sp.]